jgi:hypothetical protein
MTPLESAKAALTIPELARRRRWAWTSGRLCPAPYRSDRHPSGSVFLDGKLFHDFASGETLDAPALLGRVENLPNAAACKLFIELAGTGACNIAPIKCHIAPVRTKPRLPRLDPPSRADLKQIAEVRNVSLWSARIAAHRGFLFTTKFNGLPCWALTDEARWLCQLRRMDGEPFGRRDGDAFKALTVAGSYGAWPIGCAEASRRFNSIALVEGGGDFLAAIHFILAESRIRDVGPVAMLGGSRIAVEALPFFQQKAARIFAHADQPGIEAAARWQQQLADAGAHVHCFDLSDLLTSDGRLAKDLNDLTSLDADEFESDRQLLGLMNF